MVFLQATLFPPNSRGWCYIALKLILRRQKVPAGRYEDVPLKIYFKSKYLCDNWSNLINCKTTPRGTFTNIGYFSRNASEQIIGSANWAHCIKSVEKRENPFLESAKLHLQDTQALWAYPEILNPTQWLTSVYSICLPCKFASQTRNITLLQPSCPIIPVGRILQIEIRLL